MMNMPEASTFNDPSYIISTDDAAKRILSGVVTNGHAGAALLDIAKDVADHYSFVDHQTYPRPGHALTRKKIAAGVYLCLNYCFFALYIEYRTGRNRQANCRDEWQRGCAKATGH